MRDIEYLFIIKSSLLLLFYLLIMTLNYTTIRILFLASEITPKIHWINYWQNSWYKEYFPETMVTFVF
jgi:hypothetical protein